MRRRAEHALTKRELRGRIGVMQNKVLRLSDLTLNPYQG